MKEKENYKSLLPHDLYSQIEEIYNSFLDIQKEAAGIARNNNMPDATAYLQDVLKSTEEATHTILDSATEIQTCAAEMPDRITAKINEHVTKIYEACNFQDITGQQIKKVLKNLGSLEERISKLVLCAKLCNQEAAPSIQPDTLLNGPQLRDNVPSQNDIDKFFSS